MSDHQCPKHGCPERVPAHMLACPRHWYSVSKPIRDAVWAAWADGAGAGSPEHDAAVDAAIKAMNR